MKTETLCILLNATFPTTRTVVGTQVFNKHLPNKQVNKKQLE